MIGDNFRALCELAEDHWHQGFILCLLMPVSDYTKSKTGHRPPADILNLNHWLQSYAPDIHAEIADYYTALVDEKGMLREGYSDTACIPTHVDLN